MKTKKSKKNKFISNKRKIRHPSQTRLNEIFSKRIDTSKATVARKERPQMHQAEHQAEPRGADHQHEWVPHNAEGNLGDVERQRVGLRVEATVGPEEPGGEAREEGRAQRGQVYEPEGWEPEGLAGQGPVPVARPEEEDYGHGQRQRDWYRNGEGPKGALGLGLFFLSFCHFVWGDGCRFVE